MNKPVLFAFLLACTTAFFVSCKQHPAKVEQANYLLQGDTVVLPAGSNLLPKLKTALVQSQPYRMELFTAGTVKAIPTQYAEIAPPFAGRVIRSFARLGMQVTPETPLFEISSPDFMTAQKLFFQAKAQLQQAEKTWQRQKDLVDHGVGTQKDLEEAETAYRVEQKEYENAVMGIRLFRADPAKLVLGQPLLVRSPIAGEIIDNRIVTGQFINDNAASVAIVAQLSKVWVAGQVKEKDIRFIHALDQCSIDIPALPEKQIKGKVYHVNDMVDEETRSVQVLIECDNADRLLKPGMYVSARFTDAPVSAILIPATAVLQQSDQGVAFVMVGPGKYIRRTIIAGNADSSQVVVQSGLHVGETLVTEGGFYLLDAK